ncbi:50S ribosomal protein L20 [Candidatus Babeliales bacterium]|nr:50S ribosomal protein L20 [Candidatus Babeliales bacterium]
MSRVKRGVVTGRRHKRLLKQTKGFWGQRKNVFRRAKETLLRAMAFAFIGRKKKKRDFRVLFIKRLNAACRQHGLAYSKFIKAANDFGTKLNRKMLSQMAIFDPKAFTALISLVKKEIAPKNA